MPSLVAPQRLEDTGLDAIYVQELIIKCINAQGTPRAIDIADTLRLGYNSIEDQFEFLKQHHQVAVVGGGGQFGRQTMQYALTEKGTNRLAEVMRRDNYFGPAPYPAEKWFELVRAQSITREPVTPDRVEKAFSKLVLDASVVERIGPAINSGRSIFLYGPPGNGKTSLGECITAAMGGEVFVPYAIISGRQVVRIYDSLYHTALESPGEADKMRRDARLVRCQRPVVMVGGELTLETLDLVRTAEATWYEAPFQVKSTNGVLFIDDFGRQRMNPQDLLNRWIVPLESRFDFLTFAGGQKLRVPFDGLLVFSTNLDPKQLVDEAFLRRIRYKILIGDPSEANFRRIWDIMARLRNVQSPPGVLDYLIERHYRGKRPFRACQPRDLIDQFVDLMRFSGVAPVLSLEIIDRLVALYFADL